MGIVFTAFGHFVPDNTVSNTELSLRYNVTEDWIIDRTGIDQRHYYLEGATSDMIVKAALRCLSKADVKADDIDCIIVATMTPDYYCPSTAAIVHQKLNTKNACGFDIMAACSGYIYALQIASSLIASNSYKTILVCGADKMSSCIDTKDRRTVLVLSDGAGVSLLQHSETNNNLIDIVCKLDSTHATDVSILYGGSKMPLTKENISEDKHYLRFTGKGIFDNGVSLMYQVITEIMEKNNLSFDDIDFIIPHQSNKRMIEVLAQRLSLPIEKFIINIDYIGNTSAASIPIAISRINRKWEI